MSRKAHSSSDVRCRAKLAVHAPDQERAKFKPGCRTLSPTRCAAAFERRCRHATKAERGCDKRRDCHAPEFRIFGKSWFEGQREKKHRVTPSADGKRALHRFRRFRYGQA